MSRKPTPRQEAKSITDGDSKPHHIGKKSGSVLQQELFSLINTKEAFRDSNWKTKWIGVRELSKELGIWESFITKYKLTSNEAFKKIV